MCTWRYRRFYNGFWSTWFAPEIPKIANKVAKVCSGWPFLLVFQIFFIINLSKCLFHSMKVYTVLLKYYVAFENSLSVHKLLGLLQTCPNGQQSRQILPWVAIFNLCFVYFSYYVYTKCLFPVYESLYCTNTILWCLGKITTNGQ